MRTIAAAAFAILLTTAAHADVREDCAAAWQNMPSGDRGPMTYADWMTKCTKPNYRIGEYGAPSYTVAICKDGHFSRHRKTTHRCSHHGGIAKMLSRGFRDTVDIPYSKSAEILLVAHLLQPLHYLAVLRFLDGD